MRINKPLDQFIKDNDAIKPIPREQSPIVGEEQWYKVITPIKKSTCIGYGSSGTAQSGGVPMCKKYAHIYLEAGRIIKASNFSKSSSPNNVQSIVAFAPTATYREDGLKYIIPANSLVDASPEEVYASQNKSVVQAEEKSIFTTKNIIIGLAVIGVGFLVYKKLRK